MRACTPHFKAQQDNDQKKCILGLKQQKTDLYEQQLKVLRIGDPNFTANQFLEREDVHDNQGDEEVVLGPGDVMYHPAGIMILCLS